MASKNEEIDCRAIFNSIEDETNKLLELDLKESFKKDLINSINAKTEKLHLDIDQMGEEFINQVINSFNTQGNQVNDKKGATKEGNAQKQEKEVVVETVVVNSVENNFYQKMEVLLTSIQDLINKTFVIDAASKMFKDNTLDKLMSVRKEAFSLRVPRQIRAVIQGKTNMDLKWDDKNNKAYSSVDKLDDSKLKVNGTTCYSYYKTIPSNIKEENFAIVVEYNISTSDNYFYLGFINEKLVSTSSCLCGTQQNAFYIQPNGDVIINGARTNNTKLSAEKSKFHSVMFRLFTSEKQLFITMDDKDEQGPFTINGSSFTFVGGSCNTVNGYIKIAEAYYC